MARGSCRRRRRRWAWGRRTMLGVCQCPVFDKRAGRKERFTSQHRVPNLPKTHLQPILCLLAGIHTVPRQIKHQVLRRRDIIPHHHPRHIHQSHRRSARKSIHGINRPVQRRSIPSRQIDRPGENHAPTLSRCTPGQFRVRQRKHCIRQHARTPRIHKHGQIRLRHEFQLVDIGRDQARVHRQVGGFRPNGGDKVEAEVCFDCTSVSITSNQGTGVERG